MINDHLDVALGVDADGVHLGQDDFPLAEARRLAPELILGASTHGREEALQAVRNGADYYNIGPIFPTETKEGVSRFLGPEAIPKISKGISIPFTVMGGIKPDNLASLLAQGASKIAVVTALTQASDIQAATRAMISAIRAGQRI
jgi:thiamine-phosphate pyrophosphorylase